MARYYEAEEWTQLGTPSRNPTAGTQFLYPKTDSKWRTKNPAGTEYTFASEEWAKSRATDLITNGSGALGDNTNFTNLTYDKTDMPIGAIGVFDTVVSTYTQTQTSEFIPVDPNKKYKFAFQVKQKGVNTAGPTAFGLIAPYDAFQNAILPSNYGFTANTTTTLAAQLNPGDATVTLTSSANWYGSAAKPAGGNTFFRDFIFWDYVDPGGKAWPQETYSRNDPATYGFDLWADGSLVGNVITLRVPWAGPVKVIGTPVSNGTSGGTYMYGGAVGATVPLAWTQYSATITGFATPGLIASFATGWPAGVAQCRVGFLGNYTAGLNAGSKHSFAMVSFSDASAAQGDATLALAGLSGKEPTVTAGTTAQYYRGDKSWQTLDKTAVGLANVANLAQVDLVNNQTIAGVKTFSSNPIFQGGFTTAGYPSLTRVLNSEATLLGNNMIAGLTNSTIRRPGGADPGSYLQMHFSRGLEYGSASPTVNTDVADTTGRVFSVSPAGVLNATSQIQENSSRVFSPNNLPAFTQVSGVTTLAQMPAAGTSAQYMRGDKSWQTLDKTAVGLSNVLNVVQEPAITAGTTAQFWRGDKTWQGLTNEVIGKSGNVLTDASSSTKFTKLATVTGTGAFTDCNLSLTISANANTVARRATVVLKFRNPNTLPNAPTFLIVEGIEGDSTLINSLRFISTVHGAGANTYELWIVGFVNSETYSVYENFFTFNGNATRVYDQNATWAGATTTALVSASAVAGLNASLLGVGTVPEARLGSGTGTSAKYLRGDSTWQTLNPAAVGAEPTVTGGTTAQYYRGDKTWQTLNAAAVGITTDAAAGTGSLRTLGTGALQAAAGNHGHALTDANITGIIPDLQLPLQLRAAAGTVNQVSDCNNAVLSGVYYAVSATNKPSGAADGHIHVVAFSSIWVAHTYINATDDRRWTRIRNGTSGTWTAWSEVTMSAGTTAQYWRGDKSWQTLNPTAVGLSNVLNVAQEPASSFTVWGRTFVGYASEAAFKIGESVESKLAVGTTAQYYRGDKTWQTLNPAAVGAEPALTAGTSAQYYRGDKTWQTLNVAAVSGAAVDSAVVHNTGTETVAGVKTFSSSPVVPTPTAGVQATNKTYVDAAITGLAGVGQEMGCAERTTNFSTTNATLWSTAGGSVISSLSVTVTGTGRPVSIEFYAYGITHSANVIVTTYLIVNGVTNDANSQLRNWATTAAEGGAMLRRLVLTSGTSYTFTVGVAGVTAGTTLVAANTSSPMFLAVTQR